MESEEDTYSVGAQNSGRCAVFNKGGRLGPLVPEQVSSDELHSHSVRRS
jgi:hypothetical protein